MQQQTQQVDQIKTTPTKTAKATTTKKVKSKKQPKSVTATPVVVQETAPVAVQETAPVVVQETTSTDVATSVTKKVSLLKAPKKPRTPFNCYTVEKYPIQKKLNDDLSFGKILAVIAQDWKKMSDSDKEPYTVLSNTDRERYTTEMEVYQSQPDNMKKSGKKTKVKYTGPKRTQSMYMLFKHDISTEIKNTTPDITFGDLQKEVGMKWTALKKVETNEDTKLFEHYQKLHSVDKERYEKEFAEWSAQTADS